MTRFARAFYGAALGAGLSLLIHPVSRPYMTGVFRNWGGSQTESTTAWIPSNLRSLPQPESPQDLQVFGLWMIAGAESMKEGMLRPEHVDRLVEVADIAIKADGNNAYWYQMKAAFLAAQDREEDALGTWLAGARADTWNDQQSERLGIIRSQFAAEFDANLAWHHRVVFDLRSTAAASMINDYAKAILNRADIDSEDGLTLRYATLMNALRMRDGSRAIAIAGIGSNLIEASSYPRGMAVMTNTKRRLIARQALITSLSQRGLSDEALDAQTAFATNDAWSAYVESPEPAEVRDAWTVTALLAATLPSTCLMIGLFGLVVWVLGIGVNRWGGFERFFQPPVAPVFGILLAIFIYYLTELPLASITTVLCFAFLVFTPSSEKPRIPTDLGPTFGFVIFLIGLGVFISLASFLIGVSSAGAELLDQLNIPREYYNGSTLFLGLAGIIFGLLFLTAPSWALIEKVSTPKVVGLAFQTFGSGLCAACLALAIVTGPLAVYVDNKAADVLFKLVENEPTYHLTQQ